MSDDGMMYLRFPDGSLRGISSTPQDGTRQRVPEGATVITRDEYVRLAAEARAATVARRAELVAADQVRQRGEYESLRKAGIPEALARRLTGHKEGAAGAA